MQHSLELKLLIDPQGNCREETRALVGFIEAKINRQIALFDRKVRDVIKRTMLRLDDENMVEQEAFLIADQEFEKEFSSWPEEAANLMEKVIRYILLDWRNR